MKHNTMKTIIFLFAIIMLVSCGQKTPQIAYTMNMDSLKVVGDGLVERIHIEESFNDANGEARDKAHLVEVAHIMQAENAKGNYFHSHE